MPATDVDTLFDRAMRLSLDDRAQLIARLEESLHTIDPEIESARLEECERRLGEIERGEVEALPGETFFDPPDVRP